MRNVFPILVFYLLSLTAECAEEPGAMVLISPDSFIEPAPVVQKDFLVVGSFRDAGQAQTLLQELADFFEQVLVKTANVNGADYHRVLVGPVDESSEEEYKIRAWGIGVLDAWILRDVQVELEDSPVARSGKTGRIQTLLKEPAPDTGSYNAAKLRKKPSPFYERKTSRDKK